jgi:predicted PurR-regulated permease PerM
MTCDNPSAIPEAAPMSEIKHDLTRTILSVLFIGGLLTATFWILTPFLPSVIWATMIVVATWPVMLHVQKVLWNRRGLAVLVMSLLVLLLLIVPLLIAIATILGNADDIKDWFKSLAEFHAPLPPAWVADLPFVGESAARYWEKAAGTGVHELLAKLTPYAGSVARWVATEVGGIGVVVVQFLLTVGLTAIMYAGGEDAAAALKRFGARLGGTRGEAAIHLAGEAIRAVALGVGITAVVQSVLGGIGLALAGVPFAFLLTAVMFMLCIAQLGPSLILVPAVIWLYWSDNSGWGTFLLVWTIVVTSLDNFLRPWLIRMGADLPLLLILAGVIGGLFAFGLVGIFVGPVVLAVAYTLFEAWVGDGALSDADAARRTSD